MELWQKERLWECPSCGASSGEAKPEGGECFYCGEAWETPDRAQGKDLRSGPAVEGIGDVAEDLVSPEEGEAVAGAHSWQKLGGIAAVRGSYKKAGQGKE